MSWQSRKSAWEKDWEDLKKKEAKYAAKRQEGPTSVLIEKLDIMCCIHVEDDYIGQERLEFAETQALCIYYRGPYEGTVTAIRALAQYVKENNVEITGSFRSIYMEGPPNRGEKSGDYITQIAVPIKA